MSIQLPVITYGTLRPGAGNYLNLLNGRTISEDTVHLTGYQMRGRSGFPYVVVTGDENDHVVGTLIHVIPELYVRTLSSMDSLEGYREGSNQNHYDRIVVDYELNGEIGQAYMYVAGSGFALDMANELPIISGGDWIQHVRKSNPMYAGGNLS